MTHYLIDQDSRVVNFMVIDPTLPPKQQWHPPPDHFLIPHEVRHNGTSPGHVWDGEKFIDPNPPPPSPPSPAGIVL